MSAIDGMSDTYSQEEIEFAAKRVDESIARGGIYRVGKHGYDAGAIETLIKLARAEAELIRLQAPVPVGEIPERPKIWERLGSISRSEENLSKAAAYILALEAKLFQLSAVPVEGGDEQKVVCPCCQSDEHNDCTGEAEDAVNELLASRALLPVGGETR